MPPSGWCSDRAGRFLLDADGGAGWDVPLGTGTVLPVLPGAVLVALGLSLRRRICAV